MGGDFCNKPFPSAMNRTAATASRKLPQTVSSRHEPHWCRAEWETFRKQFPAAMNRTAVTASGETFRKQFPAAVNRTAAAPYRKLSAIVSCRHEPQSYHTEPEN